MTTRTTAAQGNAAPHTPVRLRADEAAPLVHALVARIADDLGIRALAVKGPVVAMQGLRAERPSADVDVLVHPADLDTMIEGLAAVGWRRWLVRTTYASIMPPHSVDLLSDMWPVGIDLHHYFPGFLAEPGLVFDALWARRDLVTLAGVPVPAVDSVGQAAIVALHHLRVSPEGDSPALSELEGRARQALSEAKIRELLTLARETDSTATLRPFLLALGVPEADLGAAADSDALKRWQRRVRAVGYEAWFERFAQTPVRRWPRTAWHALMLTDEEIYAYHHVPPGGASLTRLRLRRIARGAAGLPRTVRAMREVRRPRG